MPYASKVKEISLSDSLSVSVLDPRTGLIGGAGGNRTRVRALSVWGLYVRSWSITAREPDQRGHPAVCIPAFPHRVGLRVIDE